MAQPKKCVRGVACGNTCIPRGKSCRIVIRGAKKCVRGVACGNTCIPRGKSCRIGSG